LWPLPVRFPIRELSVTPLSLSVTPLSLVESW
jgi:hypothetical protein